MVKGISTIGATNMMLKSRNIFKVAEMNHKANNDLRWRDMDCKQINAAADLGKKDPKEHTERNEDGGWDLKGSLIMINIVSSST